ncbi:hypothetical protein AAG906_038461 [Vitis piasezkii]
MDFYQSMTTHHVRDPSVIHFTIDGRHGILGARHIAEALRIPYEPAKPEDYRVWTNPSPTDIVRILSRGASTGQDIWRRSSSYHVFIDALLRHNIFPLLTFGCEARIEDSSLALIILLWPPCSILKKRSIRKSYSEPMPFLYCSPDCYVRFWNTWATQMSLNLSARDFVERYSLLTNGRT